MRTIDSISYLDGIKRMGMCGEVGGEKEKVGSILVRKIMAAKP